MIFDAFQVPGMGDPVVSTESEFWAGRDEALQWVAGRIISSALDSTNTPTTTLRRALVMGQITASLKWKQYSPTATDGTQFARGVLMFPRNMLDPRTQVAADREAMFLVAGGFLKTAQLIGFDETARKHLSAGFIFDDQRDLYGGSRLVTAKTANYTVVAADNLTTFTTQGAGGTVNFTLPALVNVSPGWEATFCSEAAGAMTVTAPANKLVAFNNATATSIAFSTAGEIIGNTVRVIVNADATKYLAIVHLGTETSTPTIA
jgi:hypothetical protein